MKNKNAYITPFIKVKDMETESLLDAATVLNPNLNNQTVIPTEDPYDGEFGANQWEHRSVWDD